MGVRGTVDCCGPTFAILVSGLEWPPTFDFDFEEVPGEAGFFPPLLFFLGWAIGRLWVSSPECDSSEASLPALDFAAPRLFPVSR